MRTHADPDPAQTLPSPKVKNQGNFLILVYFLASYVIRIRIPNTRIQDSYINADWSTTIMMFFLESYRGSLVYRCKKLF
jgi:hypothetical protein